MTTLYVLGSGSAGNCFALASGDEVLMIDAGFSAREVQRRARLVGLDLGRVIGLAITLPFLLLCWMIADWGA